MAPKTTADVAKVNVMIMGIEINERAWRSMCAKNGIDLTGQVVGAHIARSVKAAGLKYLADLGFPQEGQ